MKKQYIQIEAQPNSTEKEKTIILYLRKGLSNQDAYFRFEITKNKIEHGYHKWYNRALINFSYLSPLK